MIGIDFENVAGFGDSLPRRFKHTAHLGGHKAPGFGNDAARRIRQTGRGAHVGDLVTQCLLEAFNQRLTLFGNFLRLLFFFLVGQVAQLQVTCGDGHEFLAFELKEVAHQPFVDAFPEKEHFHALLLQFFEVRRSACRLPARRHEVVNLLLAFLHARDVIIKTHVLFVRRVVGRRKAQEFENGVTVCGIFHRPFLHHAAELLPEVGVLGGFVFRHLLEHAEHAARQRLLQFLRHARFLLHLARDVERQIIRIDEPLHKAEVVRQELFGLVHDEDALHEELQAVFVFTVVEIPRGFLRNIEKRRVLKVAFHLVVRPRQGFVVSMRQVLIKLFVLLRRDVARRHGPKGLRVVDLHPFKDGFLLFVDLFAFLRSLGFFFPEVDRNRDVIRILRNCGAQRPSFKERLFVRLQMQHDVGTALRTIDFFGGVGTGAVAFPFNALAVGGFGRARVNRHLIRDDEGGIKAHAEAADQLRILCLIPGEILKESFSTGIGDRPQVFVGFFKRHADAVVADREGTGVFIGLHTDAQHRIIPQHRAVGERQKVQLIQGVGRVGNEFAKEHFLVGIKGIRQEVQKLCDFGLKPMHLSCHKT